jgi:hypothetical protein
LAILGAGFAQALYALNVANGQTEHLSEVMAVLAQAMLQCVATPSLPSKVDYSHHRSPDFERFAIRYWLLISFARRYLTYSLIVPLD